MHFKARILSVIPLIIDVIFKLDPLVDASRPDSLQLLNPTQNRLKRTAHSHELLDFLILH
jgi:hypothetical protein